MVNLRPAGPGDAAAIRRLIHEVDINPMGLDWQRFIIAANESGEMIGCGQLKPHGRQVVELASLAVVPEYRKQGVARAILEQLMAQAPRPLYLMCRPELGPFYEKFGFSRLEAEDMPAYFQRIVRLLRAYTRLTDSEHAVLVMKLQ